MSEPVTPAERTPLFPIALVCVGVSTLYVLSMLAVTDSLIVAGGLMVVEGVGNIFFDVLLITLLLPDRQTEHD